MVDGSIEKGSTFLHSRLVSEILLACGALDCCTIWQNNTGAAKQGGRFIKFGLKGSPDIIGFSCYGKFICIECKTGDATLSKQQKRFRIVAENSNCIYILAKGKTASEIKQELEAACMMR